MSKQKNIGVIGAGFAGLSAAAYLAKLGYNVHVFEKNERIGGRARQFQEKGFTFDMGPSWYWMPEVMESFFNDFDFSTKHFFELTKLSPAFDIVFKNQETLSIPNNFEELKHLFDSIEAGSSIELEQFMKEAQLKYDISMNKLIEKPGLSIQEYLDGDTIKKMVQLKIFSSYQKLVHKRFKHPKLRMLMEFPVLFLGAKPKDTPALYSMMNYAGLQLGTFYPQGGFYALVNAMEQVCTKLGVKFHTNAATKEIKVAQGKATELVFEQFNAKVDGVIGSADYQHIESKLLDKKYRNYSEKYWTKKTFAPSSLIFYLGINKRLTQLKHHTLFFDANFELHADEIYTNKQWPKKPLFYVCTPSKTDTNVAPEGCENLFILMPLATGIEDTPALREKYFKLLMDRLESHLNEKVTDHVIFKKSYCINDFVSDYNAYGGNAYGLANTLSQTAIFKPKIINKKISNLVYTGQLTVPGPGVPPSLISGKIAARMLHQSLTK